MRVPAENPDYLSRQLITYLGNKRALLGNIGVAVEQVKRRLGRNKLRVFDAFSGSGVVSRFLKAHASYLASKGVDAKLMGTKGYGDTVPIGDNATAAGRAKNRRIEFKKQ